jgi:hypothetical protein
VESFSGQFYQDTKDGQEENKTGSDSPSGF